MDEIAACGNVTVDQWQLEKLGLVTAKADVLYYVPGLPAEYPASVWGRSTPPWKRHFRRWPRACRPARGIAVIPEGPYVLARAAGA